MDSLSKQVTLIIIASAFFVIIAIGIIILILVYQKKQLQYLNEKSQMKNSFDKEIFQTQLEIQEQTLKNISQEIHDNIGQGLSLVKLNINTMNSTDPVLLKSKIDDSRNLITKAIQDLRDLSKSLNTDYIIELGLTRAIEYELEMLKKIGHYKIQFDITGDLYRLQDQQELVFFRIVQEALHNIIKHADATLIKVALIFQPQLFTLKINDNGIGFNTDELKNNNYKSPGLGIRNMNNRANIINSNFQITSIPQKGTAIILTLPLLTSKTSL
jgi:signal transduction histidine kinase